MTKILYIPTGEYLKYYYHTSDNHSGNEHVVISCILEEVMSKEVISKEDIKIEIEEILQLEYHINMFNKDWILLNNLILPVLRNELEVIKDD